MVCKPIGDPKSLLGHPKKCFNILCFNFLNILVSRYRNCRSLWYGYFEVIVVSICLVWFGLVVCYGHFFWQWARPIRGAQKHQSGDGPLTYPFSPVFLRPFIRSLQHVSCGTTCMPSMQSHHRCPIVGLSQSRPLELRRPRTNSQLVGQQLHRQYQNHHAGWQLWGDNL